MKTSNSVKDMTKGSLWKGILLFSIPLIFSNLLQILFNMSDVAVVGRFGGTIALGAVGSTTTLVTVFTNFIIGFGSGVNVVTAHAFGKKDQKEISTTVHTACIISLMTGIMLLVFGQSGAAWILELLGTKKELFSGAELYLHIYFMGLPALAIYNFGSAVFSAAGDTKKPLMYLSVSGALNVVLNLVFVILFKLDVAGVAMASAISQYVSAFCILTALMKVDGAHRLSIKKVRIHAKPAKQILAIGLPAGMQGAIFQISNLFVQYGVNTFNATVVAGNAAAQNADALVYDVMAAFYTASGSYIGQNYGAGNMHRVKQIYWISMFYAFTFGTFIGVSLVLSGKMFLSLFTKDAVVIKEGLYRLKVMGFSYGFSAFMDESISASRGIGEGFVPTVIVILGSCVFRSLWIFTVFAFFGTITSLYLLYIFSWAVTGNAEAFYFWHSLKKQQLGMSCNE
ncbi:MAG: MATE family efflux transporter [Lachnospiraceae bacterium]|nr:MATE family efflux transporter [Lachnospiraceae bacterium]